MRAASASVCRCRTTAGSSEDAPTVAVRMVSERACMASKAAARAEVRSEPESIRASAQSGSRPALRAIWRMAARVSVSRAAGISVSVISGNSSLLIMAAGSAGTATKLTSAGSHATAVKVRRRVTGWTPSTG